MSNQWVTATRRISTGLVLVALASSVAGCVTANTNVATAPTRTVGNVQTSSVAVARRMALRDSGVPRSTPRSIEGVASYYWQGKRVASGARYNPNGLTAAHRTLPFGTRIRVSDPKTQRSVIVTINDRGPFVRGRGLVLSLGGARARRRESPGRRRAPAALL
jgi:rare lipoprotein A (peptidoglycan hydrolase)